MIQNPEHFLVLELQASVDGKPLPSEVYKSRAVDVTPKHRCKHGAFACLRCGVGVESVVHTTRAGRGKEARLRKPKKVPCSSR